MLKRTKQLRLACGALGAVLFSVGSANAGQTTRVSVGSNGAQANGASYVALATCISADGRYVAFESAATNLVAGVDGFGVFVYDRQTATTTCVSVGRNGVPANSSSFSPSISADGRYVAFLSSATNLVANDTNKLTDTFVYDRQTATTRRASVATNGAQANQESYWPSLSGDGRHVAFDTEATNLVDGDTNNQRDVFVRDLQTGTTSRVSLGRSGAQANDSSSQPSLSADGRYVAFNSLATNLVAGDTNNVYDVFVYDRQTRKTTCASVGPDGAPANSTSVSPSLSADGRSVAFESGATNLVAGDTNNHSDSFVYDRQTAITTRVSVANDGTQANANSYGPNLSANGRYVAFESPATNLVDGDTNRFSDSFVYDRQTAKIVRATVANNGTQANSFSYGPSLSGDGRYVVFDSDATNLVANDTNGLNDVFVHDCAGDDTLSLAVNNARTFAEGSAGSPGFTTFTVQLSKPDTHTITVNYQTADGTAKAGSDYAAKSGTLTFAPGEITKFVRANFIGDDVPELAETFFLDLKSPVNAVVTDSRGSAYIGNDDGPGIVINNAVPVNEGNSGTAPQVFSVMLGATSSHIVTVDWSTANGTAGPADYTVASGTITFLPGETSKIITILVKGDTTVEPTETYTVNLSSPTYAVLVDSQGVAYIRNDDTAAPLLFEDDAPSE